MSRKAISRNLAIPTLIGHLLLLRIASGHRALIRLTSLVDSSESISYIQVGEIRVDPTQIDTKFVFVLEPEQGIWVYTKANRTARSLSIEGIVEQDRYISSNEESRPTVIQTDSLGPQEHQITRHQVWFYDHDGRFMTRLTVADGSPILYPPDPPDTSPYEFKQWSHDLKSIDESMRVDALVHETG